MNEKQKRKAKSQDAESASEAGASEKLSPNKKPAADAKAVPLKGRKRKVRKSSEKHIDEIQSNSKESTCSEEHVEDLNNKSDQLGEISSSSQPKTPPGRKPLYVVTRPTYVLEYRSCTVPVDPTDPRDSYENVIPKYKAEKSLSNTLHGSKSNPKPINPRPPVYIKKPTSKLDIETVGNYVKKKKVVATKKKIGFIGLGTIGQGIVKSLLNTGHDVTVWNLTAETCEPFVAAGARCASTPADVVLASDIIFSCLKDQEAVKTVVHRSEGVLNGFGRSSELGKIYAEMTLINKETSEHIRENIEELNGKYLEAGFYGTKEMAENGELYLTVAGDPDAYKDCESCFRAMAQTAKYTGTNLGNVTNIAIHAFEGKLTAFVAETMSIAKKANISQSEFLNIIKHSPYDCELIKDTGEAILSQDYSPKVSVSRALNAMELMSGSKNSASSYVGCAIQTLYAKAEQFGYGSHDMSSAYLMYDLPGHSGTSAQEVQSESDVTSSCNQL